MSSEGIPFKEYAITNKIDISEISDIAYLSYDTIKDEIIYAGKFDVSEKYLSSKPIVYNKEILGLDTVTDKIKLSASAVNKIVLLKPYMKNGIQFAICIDKRPVFTGYLWNSFSSYGSTWNNIEYKIQMVACDTLLNIYKGNGIDATKREKINFKKYPQLLDAFENSNRILK